MPTTIDSLQIEIQSNSTNAASGIKELAKSLGELKKSGTVSTAVKNLDKLSESLRSFADASNATRSVGKLVGAMSKLKEVGSVAGIANSLSKLSVGLNALENVNIDNVAPQVQRIAEAVAPLSEVKAGGLTSMVNALSKIGKVTESLDDDKIDAFADRVAKLTAKLEPLSTKMTTIQSGLKSVNSNARSAGSSVKKMGEDVDGASVNLSSFVYIIQEAVQWLQQAIQKFKSFMAQAVEWDGISARFGRGFGDQAQETYDWIQRLNDEMGINVQQFMKYSSVYATMLTGFGVAVEDATQMALGYTELTYDIWAGYNDIYKTFDDAAEAVKSAIAGEVEPIRRAGFTIVESTLEMTAANHGLEISLANATEAQKSYLRYLTLVDQAYSQSLVGTYAKELETAEGLMRTAEQQAKSLAQAFGSLFLPLLVRAMPYVQAFIELLTDGVQAIAALFGITIQGVDWSGYNSGIGGAAEGADNLKDSVNGATEAVKELKNASIGIDELNVISPTASAGSGAGGSGGGTGFEDLDVDSLWDESIFKDINSQVDAIKEKIEGWLPAIAAVASAFGTLSLGLLLAQMGEGLEELAKMDGHVAKLKKSLYGLAIITVEAVLVFMLADEYLETGNLLPLIGEALATAAGGYLMYKGFGAKGLVFSLAVSMATQLAAITMNLADGGVEMDDPELWIQSAFTTALGGVTGGFLSYKGLTKLTTGQGAVFGVLAGLSLTLASITIGEITADGFGLESAITGALSTIAGGAAGAALVTFLGIATGGTGFLIGAAVMLAVNVIGAIVGSVSEDAEKSVEEDLLSRFGNVELSISEIRVFIEKLTPEWSKGTNHAVMLRNGVESLIKQIETQEDVLGASEWQVSVGIALTPDEISSYKTAIDIFVEACQAYVSDRGYALEVGLEATTNNESIAASAATVTAMATAELESLGKKLQGTVNKAYEDGLLDIDELEAIQTIRNDMREIVNALNASEIEAEFDMLKMNWSGVELTTESFNNLVSEWENVLENEIKPALESTVKENLKTLQGNVAYLEIALEKDPDNEKLKVQLNEAKEALENYIAENPLENLTIEAIIEGVTFAVGTLQDAFAAELERVRNEGHFDFSKKLDFAIEVRPGVKFDDGNGDIYGNIDILTGTIQGEMERASSTLSKEARKNLEAMLEAIKPTVEDLEDVAKEHRKLGKEVPKSVRDGLSDYNELRALKGDADGINYLIGQGFSQDPVFLNTLATVEGAGSNITGSLRDGLLNNLDYVTDTASGMVVGIKDSVTGKTIELTPTLVKNMEDMGVDLSKGLEKGLEKEEPTLWEKVKGWAGNVLGKMRETWDINSPSEETKELGKYLSQGLGEGMGTNAIKDKLSSMWNTAKTWWDNKKGNLKTYTPSIGSIYTKLKERWDSARDWYNNKKAKLKEYTPSIGSIYEKVYDRWKNARDWWNGKKGSFKTYTPSIGSITDKLKSAWNSAKKWWNSNVKLSTKLNIQVPTIKVKWDTATAFGKSFKYPTGFSLKFAADGGIFDQGSLIWAGERGAEVVANAGGGKTGVMNVQQMQDAVYEGVYAAVVAAMRGNNEGGSQSVNVYLDGRQITAAVEQRQRERGAAIMGNQVYSY